MQIFSNLILAFLVIAGLNSCEKANQGKLPDEKAIQNIVQSYQNAYNSQDAKKLAENWASDSFYINPVSGDTVIGKEEIEKLFKEKFAQDKKRHLEIIIENIAFPNNDEAIETGMMKITIDDAPEQVLAYKTEYVKEKGQWFIQAINEIELQEPTSNFEQLKELEWLVGKWEDNDGNVEILFDNQWDKFKNFITQHFVMKIHGHDDLEGKQIIAWDSVNEKIRSWVFDSDGEFGEGSWEKVGPSWEATMHFTLSDGRNAMAKNIYTPIDDQSYLFASYEREVEGEILPDLDPVTVQKVE